MWVFIDPSAGKPWEIGLIKKLCFFSPMMTTYEICDVRECALGITERRTYTGRLPVCTSKVKLWINRSPKAQRLDGCVFSERESCWLGFSLLQIPFHRIASITLLPPPVYTAAALPPVLSSTHSCLRRDEICITTHQHSWCRPPLR